MIDKDAQLAILADALTKIVDVATIGADATAPAVELLARAGDLAAQALAAAATYGPLPSPAESADFMREIPSNENPR
jgi:dihydrodipicolinate synthase/N-acetylneuraminate lyase